MPAVKALGRPWPLVSTHLSYRWSNSCSGRSKAARAKARKPKGFGIFFFNVLLSWIYTLAVKNRSVAKHQKTLLSRFWSWRFF